MAGPFSSNYEDLFFCGHAKVEMFVICTPEQSEAMLDELVALERELSASLGLHFKVLDMPTADLGAPAYRKIDFEVREEMTPSKLRRWSLALYPGPLMHVLCATDRAVYLHTMNEARSCLDHAANGTATRAVDRVDHPCSAGMDAGHGAVRRDQLGQQLHRLPGTPARVRQRRRVDLLAVILRCNSYGGRESEPVDAFSIMQYPYCAP